MVCGLYLTDRCLTFLLCYIVINEMMWHFMFVEMGNRKWCACTCVQKRILCFCCSLQVGPALVFCTFLSAPIIYISARMALVRNVNHHDYKNIVTNTRTDCSIVSIVSVVRLMVCIPYIICLVVVYCQETQVCPTVYVLT